LSHKRLHWLRRSFWSIPTTDNIVTQTKYKPWACLSFRPSTQISAAQDVTYKTSAF